MRGQTPLEPAAGSSECIQPLARQTERGWLASTPKKLSDGSRRRGASFAPLNQRAGNSCRQSVISSALFDRGSGAFSVLLSGFFAKWFFIAPTGTIRVGNTGDLIALSFFMALGLAIAAVVEALHRVASDLVEANQKLTASEIEKDLLLEEASHRFRNDLTMLGAMLRCTRTDARIAGRRCRSPLSGGSGSCARSRA